MQRNKRVRVVCVHARQGRDNFGCFLVLLRYCIQKFIYIYSTLVVVWTAVCLIGYSGYLTDFREPLSPLHRCHTILTTALRNQWLIYTCADCVAMTINKRNLTATQFRLHNEMPLIVNNIHHWVNILSHLSLSLTHTHTQKKIQHKKASRQYQK